MKTFTTCIFLLIYSVCNCQLATYEWANKVSATATAKKALIDGAGNIYVWINNNTNTLTINSTTYTTDNFYNFLVKYNNSGNVLWVKPMKAFIANISLTSDSSSILLCGSYTSNYTSIDFGNGVSLGSTVYCSGFIYKIDGATSNTLWAKNFDALLPNLSVPTVVNAIYQTAKGIFIIQGTKLRRLDETGNELWVRTVAFNGTAYTIESKAFKSWADDNGNTFYTGVSDNGNTTTVTINGIGYTTFGNNNVCRTYFSLDSNGNTNWVNPNINFQPNRVVEVTKAGELVIAGTYIYNGLGGASNHPFLPNYCNRDYNIFKADLKTGKPLQSAYSLRIDNGHLASDGCLYLTVVKESAGIGYKVATTSRVYTPTLSSNYLYVLRFNQNFEPDSVFSVATLGSSVSAGILNFYRTNQGKLIYFMNRNNVAVNFANGNANTNASTTPYQALIQFNPPNLPAMHTTTWTGVTDGNWFTATNWNNGIPTDTSNVIIPAGSPNYTNNNNAYYNFSTALYAKCGSLKVDAGVDIILGAFVIVDGIINNNGTLTYHYNFTGNQGNYNIWSSNNFYNSYLLGNGTIKYRAIDGMYFNIIRPANNKIVVDLLTPTSTLYFTDCKALKNISLLNGNLDFSQTTTPFMYLDSGVSFTANARFLNGSITQRAKNNTPVTFPLGTASNVQPAIITLNNIIADNYLTASFTNVISGAAPNPANCIVDGQGIPSILNGGIWTVKSEYPLNIGATYNATFKLKGSTNTASANRYALLKRNNSASNWQVAGNYLPAQDSATYVISKASGISSFSDFAIGIATGALPLNFISFTAQKCYNNQVCLNWKTTNENNVSHFLIERSIDGINFVVTSKTTALNQANNNYNAIDNLTALQNIKQLYYRIKQVDKDGKYNYTKIIVIKLKNLGVEVFPTIATNTITIINNKATTMFKLYDTNGKLVLQKNILTGNTIVHVTQLAKGIYFYKLDVNEFETGKIIKQ